MMAESDRTQPEFSVGERLARLEGEVEGSRAIAQELQEQIDRRFRDTYAEVDRRFAQIKELFNEKLDGVRREVEAKSTAQKEAVEKAEQASSRRFETFIEADARKGEVTQNRLGALERGESTATGGRITQGEMITRWIAAVAVLVTIGLLAVQLAHG
jgi:hypothetical protein